MELGFLENVKVILHSLHHVLHLSAICFLILYLFKALYSSSSLSSSCSILYILSFLYCLHNFRYDPASPTNPTLYPPYRGSVAPTVRRDVFLKLCLALFSLTSAIQLNCNYTPAAIAKLCANFAIIFVLGMMVGTLYTALTLSRLANCGGVDMEKQKRWLDLMIKWSVEMGRASRWIAVGVAVLLFADSILQLFTALNDGIRSVIWRWAAAGLSVGVFPLVFLCAISTQAALDLACRKHYEQCTQYQNLLERRHTYAARCGWGQGDPPLPALEGETGNPQPPTTPSRVCGASPAEAPDAVLTHKL